MSITSSLDIKIILFLLSTTIAWEIENFSLKKTDTYEYLYMDEVYIEVPENLNQKFLDLVEKEMSFLAKFNYISSKKIRLISFKRYR